MRKALIAVLGLSASVAWSALAGEAGAPAWPSLPDQLAQARAASGTALAKLIAANQDFSVLRPEEANDTLGIPPWLRVFWRQAHPEGLFAGDDPTGGYPRALHEVFEWMTTHPDLTPGAPPPALRPGEKAASAGTNVSASGTQTSARSESDIRINYWNPQRIFSASNDISASGVQGIYYSLDGGATWGRTSLSLFTGDAFHSDPTADWTSDGKAWSATLGITSNNKLRGRMYVSTDNGATWSQEGTWSKTTAPEQTAVDKEMVWFDHAATKADGSPNPYKDQAYVIYHDNNPAFMNRRTAGAAGTWGAPVQVSGAESAGTCIGADVKTNRDGDVFGFWPTTGNSKVLVVKSTNGGTSYGTPVQVAATIDSYDIGVPSFNGRRALIYVSGGAYRTTTKNLVYATWTDLTGEVGCTAPANEPGATVSSTCKTRIWFARSLDGGATWGAKTMLNNQAGKNDQFNQWMAVDETTGALGVMYYDTVADPNRLKADVWYQSSFDDGASWHAAVKVTTAMTDETAASADSGNQYGDYNGLSGYAGAFFPSWTDRRNNAREEIWTAKITDLTPVTLLGFGAD